MGRADEGGEAGRAKLLHEHLNEAVMVHVFIAYVAVVVYTMTEMHGQLGATSLGCPLVRKVAN
jgi:hypothetical protein